MDEIGLLKVTRVGGPPAEGAVEHEGQTISADDVAVCMTVNATTVGEAGSSSPYLFARALGHRRRRILLSFRPAGGPS